jgi:hypothetical protein
MDAQLGYNQIPMYVDDKDKTDFMTEGANYKYDVMSFGLKNAEATYKRMMNKVFNKKIRDIMEVYMDDMIVKSTTETEHKAHLNAVSQKCDKTI